MLLIDEIDRSDSEFEAFLLEFLSRLPDHDPGARARCARARPPIVVLTSNRTRELHDALKRRCLYHWIPFPDAERERAILPRAGARARRGGGGCARRGDQARARASGCSSGPGIAETIDWAQGAQALAAEGAAWPEALRRSLGLLLKEQEDVERVARGSTAGRRDARSRGCWRASTCTGFLRALSDAGVAVAPPKQADFLRVARRVAAGGHRRALLARAGDAARQRRGRRSASTRCSPRSSAAGRLLVHERRGRRARGARARPPRRAGAARGELEALEPRPGSGLHASPLDLAKACAGSATPRRARATALARARAALVDGVCPQVAARRSERARRGRAARPAARARRRHPHGRRGRRARVAQAAGARRGGCCVLIDVSGSLRAHSPDLLRFAHVVVRATDRAEAFTFGTRLTRVTRELDTPDVDRRARRRCRRCVLDADGGTRIGVALSAVPGQRPLRRAGARRARDRHVRRARARRSGADGRRRPSGSRGSATGSCGGRRSPATRPTGRSRAGCRRCSATSTSWPERATSLVSSNEVRRLPQASARPRRTAIRAWSPT